MLSALNEMHHGVGKVWYYLYTFFLRHKLNLGRIHFLDFKNICKESDDSYYYKIKFKFILI